MIPSQDNWRGVAIAAAVGTGIVVAYAIGWGTRVGWLGVGIIGLVVLFVAVRMDLHGGFAVPEETAGASDVKLLARQQREQAGRTPEQRLDTSEKARMRRRALALAKSVGLVIAVVGFGMFVIHQL